MKRKLGEVRIDSDRVKSPMYWPVRGARNDDWRRDLPEPRATERIVGGVVGELAAVNPVLTPLDVGMGASARVLNGTRPLHITASENWEYVRAMEAGRGRSSNGGRSVPMDAVLRAHLGG